MYADSEMSFFGRENLRNSAFQRGKTFFIYSSKRNSSAPCVHVTKTVCLSAADNLPFAKHVLDSFVLNSANFGLLIRLFLSSLSTASQDLTKFPYFSNNLTLKKSQFKYMIYRKK